MSILATDLKFVASERMVDNATATVGVGGGGGRGATVISGVSENQIFPDVMPTDRLSGAVQYRKVYPSVLSNENDVLFNAQAGFLARPTDPNVLVCASLVSDAALAADAASANALESYARQQLAYRSWEYQPFSGTPGTGTNTAALSASHTFAVGDLAFVAQGSLAGANPVGSRRIVTAVSGSNVTFDGATFPNSLPATFSKLIPAGNINVGTDAALQFVDASKVRPSALSLTTAGVSAGATALVVDRLFAQFDVAGTLQHPLYYAGDVVLVQHPSTPATRELATVASVNYTTGAVSFTAGLANAYPTGTKLTRPLSFGQMRASVSLSPVTLQAWSKSWTDPNPTTVPAVSARYDGLPLVTNEGAIQDRWAVIFTSSTEYRVLSQRFGQIATGTVGTNCAPLNPMTSTPYFTLESSKWGTGWFPGYTVRFNTMHAAGPMWLVRVTKPSTAAGAVTASLFMRGDVNA